MESAITALLYLRFTSIKNGIATRVKRLKQPKYLFGAIVGIGYFYFAVLRRLTGVAPIPAMVTGDSPSNVIDIYQSEFVTGGALIFSILILLYWLWPRARAALTFTEAEIAFLFPAPISRRTLIHYRIINLALGMLFTALIFAIFSRGRGFVSDHFLIRLIGWWSLLFAMSLHSMASSFVITRLLDRGVTSLRRQVLVAVCVISVITILWIWASRSLPAPDTADLLDFSAMRHYLVKLFNTAPLAWILLPPKLIVAPVFAASWSAFLVAMLPTALMVTIHYYWVLRTEVAFEEASIVKAEKRAVKVAAMRAGKVRIGHTPPKAQRAPFNLNVVKRPEMAFLWKNLLSSASYLRPKTMGYAVVIVVALCTWVNNGDHALIRTIILSMCGAFSAYAILLGPLVARQDLRSDLPNADVMKTYPLRGWQVMLGEMLAPVSILTFIFWILLLAFSLCVQIEHVKWMTPIIHWGITLAVGVIAPLLCVIELLVLNAAALMFPAWT